MGEPYEVNIKTTADESGAQQIEGSLDRVKEKAAEVNAAPTRPPAGPETAISEAAVEARMTAEERINSIYTQRQILADLELEKTQAIAAGDTERAALLEVELNILRQALQLQTSAALSETEAVAIATERVAAEAQITFQKQLQALAAKEQDGANALAGVSLGRARAEAFTLTRELGTGASTTRTIGALLGSLGPQIGIATFAAYLLYQNFDKIEGAIQAVANALAGVDASLAEQIKKGHQFEITLRDAGKKSVDDLASSVEKLNDEITLLHDDYLKAVLDGDDKLAASLQKQLTAKTQLRDLYAEEEQFARSLATLEEQRTAELQRQGAIRKTEIQSQSEVTKLEKEIAATRDAGFTNTQKLDLYRQKVLDIQAALKNLGIAATSPHEAEIKSIALSDEVRLKVLEQVKAWQDVNGEQKKTNAAIDEERRKIEETNAGALAEKIRLLREAEKYNPTAGHGAEADRLEGKGPGAGKVDESYYKAILDKDPTDVNANLAMEAITKQKIAAQDVLIKNSGAATTAITDIAKSGTETLAKTVSDTSAAITPLFQPVADRISTDIPRAIEEGVAKLNAAVTAGVGNIAADFKGQIADLQQQIDTIWQNI
jgi:hypothetical protein